MEVGMKKKEKKHTHTHTHTPELKKIITNTTVMCIKIPLQPENKLYNA